METHDLTPTRRSYPIDRHHHPRRAHEDGAPRHPVVRRIASRGLVEGERHSRNRGTVHDEYGDTLREVVGDPHCGPRTSTQKTGVWWEYSGVLDGRSGVTKKEKEN